MVSTLVRWYVSALVVVMTTLCLLLTASCGSEVTSGEDYGDLMSSPSGLALSAHEHKHGWGKTDCTSCHVLSNIHISTSEQGYDMEAVRAEVESEGLSSCSTCHGDNGSDGPTCASCHDGGVEDD